MKLIFNISAPMQSYGKDIHTAYRETHTHPTKSAIIGMVGAALGYRRGDKRLKDLYNDLNFSYKTLKQGSIMCDYQNAHYQKSPKQDPFSRNCPSKQIWRYYIQDAEFEITLEGNDALMKTIEHSLKHPYFSLYLGRRSCPLDRPLSIKVA